MTRNRAELSEEMIARIERGLAAKEAEKVRVAGILARDREDQRAEQRREDAIAALEVGNLAALADAAIGPTPEQLGKGEFRKVRLEKVEGSARVSETVRRVIEDRLLKLYQRGVLDRDTLRACLWYRRCYEEAGLNITISAGTLAPHIRSGIGKRDHLPKSNYAMEAWEDYRFARDSISSDVRGIFDLVVLDNMTIDDAAKRARCRFANASAAVTRGALELLGAISHRLPILQASDLV